MLHSSDGGGRRGEAMATGIWSALKPDARFGRVTEITPSLLRAQGVEGLILDLDNTLALWNGPEPAPGVAAWLGELGRNGVRRVVLSNNVPARVEAFGARVGVSALSRAGKPRARAFARALAVLGTAPERTAVVGDRLFMDVWGGNRAGLRTFLVAPVDRRELWATRLVRGLEEALVARLPSQGA
jgi:HAD superfamily phosphatase (TIGR01668 family)